MASADKQVKWEGKAMAKLLKSTAEQVWPLLEDFCSLHKWLPSIDTCYKVEGVEGVVRYCASSGPPPAVKWCHEKLVAIDPTAKWLTYEIMDNNFGFKDYKSTLAVNDGDDPSGCEIEWSFEADPVEGLSYEDLCAYINFNLQSMAKTIDKALESSSSA